MKIRILQKTAYRALYFSTALLCAIEMNQLSGQIDDDYETFWSQEEIRANLNEALTVSLVEKAKITEDDQLILKQAMDIMADGEEGMDQALGLLTSSVTDDCSPYILQTIGSIYGQRNDAENAIHWYEKTMESYPHFTVVEKNLGIMLAFKGEHERALPFLIKAIEHGSENNTIYGLTGMCYFNLGKNVAAEGAYRKATLLDPSVRDWQVGLAQCLIQQQKHSKSIAVLQELLTADPSNALVWMLQCNAYIQQGNLEEALANLEIVDRLGESSPDSLELLGNIYMDQGLPERSIACFKKALRLDETADTDSYISIANLFVGYGQLQPAQSYIDDIRKKSAGNLTQEQETNLLQMESRIALSIGSENTYIPILERLIELDPQDQIALLMLAEYYSGQDTAEGYKKADTYFEHIKQIPDRSPNEQATVMVAQAISYVARELYHKALPLLEEANTIHPQDHIADYIEQIRRTISAR